MSSRVGIADIVKALKGALCLAIWNLVNSKVSSTLQHFDVLGICISISIRTIGCVCVRTYRRGLNVACSDTKAIPEPQIAEQQQCSPAFLYANS